MHLACTDCALTGDREGREPAEAVEVGGWDDIHVITPSQPQVIAPSQPPVIGNSVKQEVDGALPVVESEAKPVETGDVLGDGSNTQKTKTSSVGSRLRAGQRHKARYK